MSGLECYECSKWVGHCQCPPVDKELNIMTELDPNESNPVRLWAEIWKFRSEAKGPEGFDTWRDAAINEKIRRLKAERDLQTLKDRLVTAVKDL